MGGIEEFTTNSGNTKKQKAQLVATVDAFPSF